MTDVPLSPESSFPPETVVPEPTNRVPVWLWLTFGGLIPVCVGLMLIPGLPLVVGATGLLFVPLLPLFVLVQLGTRSLNARAAAVAYWCMLVFGWVCVVGVATLSPFVSNSGVAPGGTAKALLAFALSGASAAAGFACFHPAGRRLAARWLPLRPDSFTEVTALATAVPLLAGCLIPLIIVGQPPLLAAANNAKAGEVDIDTTAGLYAQLVWVVPFAVFAAGFPINRRFREAVDRLGLGSLSFGQVGVAVAVAVALVPLVGGYESVQGWLWDRLGWPKTDTHTFEKMMQSLITPAGAVAVGVSAGVGEELMVRGLLQPRLGLWLSNALFAALHAFQYHWDGVLGVFLIGLVCGVVRRRLNTTASIIVHGLYDFFIVMIAYYSGAGL